METKKQKRDDLKIQEYNYIKLTMILDEFLLQNGYKVETVDNSYVIDISKNTPVSISHNEIIAYETALSLICKKVLAKYEPYFTKNILIQKAIDDEQKIENKYKKQLEKRNKVE